jgi:HlyD family secretion protein
VSGCLTLLALTTGCEWPLEGKDRSARSVSQPLRKVEVVHPERRTIRRSVGEPGQIQAFETTPIHAKITGYVKAWTVNIGDQIKTGQVLAELAVPELEAELNQKRAAIEQAEAERARAESAVQVAQAAVVSAEAKLAEARAGVKRAQSDLERWQAEYRRVEQLFRERAQTGSLLDETRNKLRSAEAAREEVAAQVKTAEAALTQTQAALDHAHAEVVAAAAAVDVAHEDARRIETLLGYTKIVAPYDGIVIRRNIDTGDLTKPGAETEPLFVVARSDLVTIAVDVPELFAPEVNPGDPVEIKLQAMKGKAVAGQVTRTSWALDPKTRTLRVEIDLPNTAGTLRPGLYAYATVIAEEHADVLTIPTTAVVTEKEQSVCFTVARGKAARRAIKVGLSDGTRTEVLSGLEGNEAVVKANAASLDDGQPVEPVDLAEPPASAGKP